MDSFGLSDWSTLFNARQLLALTTFARLVGEAYEHMIESGMEVEYAKAVTTYLGLAEDRLVEHST